MFPEPLFLNGLYVLSVSKKHRPLERELTTQPAGVLDMELLEGRGNGSTGAGGSALAGESENGWNMLNSFFKNIDWDLYASRGHRVIT